MLRWRGGEVRRTFVQRLGAVPGPVALRLDPRRASPPGDEQRRRVRMRCDGRAIVDCPEAGLDAKLHIAPAALDRRPSAGRHEDTPGCGMLRKLVRGPGSIRGEHALRCDVDNSYMRGERPLFDLGLRTKANTPPSGDVLPSR